MACLRWLLIFFFSCHWSAVRAQSQDTFYALHDVTGNHARAGLSTRMLLSPQEAPIEYSKLEASRRVYVRPNGEQDNIISITPETQGHIVIENYADIPNKRMIAICQHGGNVGAGMWWSGVAGKGMGVRLRAQNPKPIRDGDFKGTKVAVSGFDGSVVHFEAPLLDSVRALRARASGGRDDCTAVRSRARQAGIPIAEQAVKAVLIESSEHKVVYERESVERTASGPTTKHRLTLESPPGTQLLVNQEDLSFTANGTFWMTYLTANISHLTPYKPLDLLTSSARNAVKFDIARSAHGGLSPDEETELKLAIRGLEDLSMLVFHEKQLAGGWRFLTYFGRDTLQVGQMLRPLLNPNVTENLMEAVLERLSGPNEEVVMQGRYMHDAMGAEITMQGPARTSLGGEVAHEESLLDQAAFERLENALRTGSLLTEADLSTLNKPIYDYKMIDDDFMLVSLLADYMFDTKIDEEAKRRFLDRTNRSDRKNSESIRNAMEFVASRAVAYSNSVVAGTPDPKALVSLYEGLTVGDWRDSSTGLARGRIPSSVNLVLVPTTLQKAVNLAAVLEMPTEELSSLAKAWEHARGHFLVSLSQDQLRELLRFYLEVSCIPENRAFFGDKLIQLEPNITVSDFVKGKELTGKHRDGIQFYAVSLDDKGQTIPVMTSDAFTGLIGATAQPGAVERACEAMNNEYPLGLGMKVGKLITNAALVNDSALYDIMGPGRYHGEVFWPWQMALALAGLLDQEPKLRKAGHHRVADLARDTCDGIVRAVKASGLYQTLELYAFEVRDGEERAQAVRGAAGQDFDTWPGNNPQLWGAALPIVVWARRMNLL